MKGFFIFLFIAGVIFSGCVGPEQRAVKAGDNISVDYIGSYEDGKVFDTSIEEVAKENNIFQDGRTYNWFNFSVGKKQVIEGFDEGVIGMKVGDSRKLIIPPEKGYGPVNPDLIQVIPVVEKVPAIRSFPKSREIPLAQFERIFGTGHKVGEDIPYSQTNINLTIKNISTNVSFSFNLTAGKKIMQPGSPWNETVIKVDDKNITVKPDVKRGDIVRLPGAPWNTTVVDVNDEEITLKHNAIPDSEVQTMTGQIRVHFNETAITMDRNSEVAGKTLIFNVTLRSIH